MTAGADIVTLDHEGEIAIVTLDNPPVNATSAALRAGLVEAIGRVCADEAVRAIVLICAGRTFVAGADVNEFGKPRAEPSLQDVMAALEGATTPIVAAVHGTALGGGFELAMACHHRIATPKAAFGLPEVSLGVIPGAGGTQRLPRLAGVATALGVIVEGKRLVGAAALEAGVVDALAASEESLRADAIAFARDLLARNLPRERLLRRVRDETGKLAPDPAAFEAARAYAAKRLRGQVAPVRAIACVEAALDRPFEEGLALERETFRELETGPQSKALRHAFFAEREAAKIPGIGKDVPTRPIERVGIVGAGTMGTGIAMAFLDAGFPVTIVEAKDEALARGRGMIEKTYAGAADKGRISRREAEVRLGRLATSLSYDDLADADLVVEAAFETMEVKQAVFQALDRVAKPGALLATNTSYLDVDEIAAATARPQDVLGLHFFSPANIMKLLEVVRAEKTAPDAIATAMALAKRLRKIAVCVGVAHGFVGNRMLARRQAEATNLVLEGAMPWDVDRVLVAFGLPMGPFQMSDLAGLDLGWSRETSKGETLKERLCERDRRGQKTKAGFYDYDDARKGSPSAVTEEIVLAMSAEKGIARRAISDEEILERCLYPMIAEGARILEEGKAIRGSDIDVVWINGYGFPAWRGGPMFFADETGLAAIVDALDRHAATHGEAYGAPALLRRLAAEGGRLSDI
ncbi:3-hydroxyacyl-CoA dehydrogenase NAD-binding domain-containing protein [Salinarimonas ramus]|uniref:3-hydroxyacyl-CoA dehydrogenase n=1 Tax=Salinarimonas ramus TaxID=690164 RepID=A0A917QCK2_9HYPH|nr:3-hydroxyacyl-CoA dehydrogenase NAD-binding domain-containing protein [Salinarimonas ramus]GGK43486.1 3-hydroxyacyl-CoA dehydrogenase [Salinarimonas ramus]